MRLVGTPSSVTGRGRPGCGTSLGRLISHELLPVRLATLTCAPIHNVAARPPYIPSVKIRPWHIAGVVLLLCCGGLAAYALWPDAEGSDGTAPEERPNVTPETAEVEVISVEPRDFALRAEANGYLVPWREAEVSAELGGLVTRRVVEEGSRVGDGALLLKLDDRQYNIALKEAEAGLLKVRAEYEASRVGDSNSDATRSAVQQATIGVTQAENAVEKAKLNLQHTSIRAPFPGRVADISVEEGQRVGSGQPVLRILDDRRMKVEVAVVESELVKMRAGASALVRVPSLDNAVFEGTILSVNPSVDPASGTGRVTVAVPNSENRLVSGLFAYVALETERLAERIVVPSVAVLVRQGRDLVFTVKGGKAQWTYVTVGAKSGGQTEILEGLSPGDLVAVSNHFALAHDAPVTETVIDAPVTVIEDVGG